MDIIEFLQDISFKGIKLSPNGEKLRIGGFQSVLTPDLVAQLKQHKGEILQLLDESPDILNVYPLSSGQQAMWFLWQLAPDQATYNVALTCRICCPINITALQKTFQTLIERHPMLGSTFPKQGNKPVQHLYKTQFPDFQQIDASSWSEAELDQKVFQEYLQPFDIENGPVMRVRLFTCSQQDHVLLLSVHHVALDAWCLPLLMEEIILLYPELASGEQPALTPLNHSYIDYVRWQQELLTSSQGEQLWSYWQQQLAGDLPVLNLPTDRPRPPIQTYNGTSHHFTLTEQLTEQLRELARKQSATPYMVLLAAFQVLLYRYTGQEDILVGVPTSGRTQPEFVPLVGYFVDPVVMRGNLSGNPSFQEFLAQIRTCVLDGLAYQDFPFALLVERLQLQRDPSRSPIFQATFNFVLQNLQQYPHAQQLLRGSQVEYQGFHLKPYRISQMEGQFDLDLRMAQEHSCLSGDFIYNTDLFDAETIAQITRHFVNLLAAIVSNPEETIAQLPLLSQAERDCAIAHAQINTSIATVIDLHSNQPHPVYILDAYGEIVPMGVEGEIYIRDVAETAEDTEHKPDRKTGYWGRQRRDGSIEVLGLKQRQAWIQGDRVNLQKIEQILLSVAGVEDGYVLVRQQELVAYVVGNESLSTEFLTRHLQTHWSDLRFPVTWVLVSTLPLTPDGEIDETVLKSVPVIDDELLQQWQQQFNQTPEIQQAVVIAGRADDSPAPMHLSKLLPAGTRNMRQPIAETTSVVGGVPNDETAESTKWAISKGDCLEIPEDAPKTLTAALIQTATQHKDKGITYISTEGETVFQSYSNLLNQAKCILNGLQNKGLKPGDRVILQIASLQEYFPTLWGCILGGIQPVTVTIAPTYREKNAVVDKLYNTWELLEHPYIIASDHLIAPLENWRSRLSQSELKILAVGELKTASPASDFYCPHPEEVAFLQLTSGSTGVPKCIQETHAGIITHIHAAQQFNRYKTADISLNWLPVDHVVPILTCHFKDTYLGCQQIEVETPVILTDPLKWLDLMEQYRVSHSWSPNFGFKRVSEELIKNSQKTWDLSCVKFLMNAGEQVTSKVVNEFINLVAPFGISSQVMQPAFGMAEVCTCMTYQNQFGAETGIYRVKKSSAGNQLELTRDRDESIDFIDLGAPVPGVEIRIVNSDNILLPEGVIGRFQIKGKVVTPGYLNNAKANAEAFVGEGWFNTGDLGFILNGNLVITGREKEVIIINGVNYYCYEIEDIVNNIPGVKPTYTGACSFSNSETGSEGLAIFFVPEKTESQPNLALIQEITQAVTVQMGITPSYVIPLKYQEFPKTTSGKIQRSQLKQKLASGEWNELIQTMEIKRGKNTIPNWFYQKVWGQKEVPINPIPIVKKAVIAFVDKMGLGSAIIGNLERQNYPCIQVELGDKFTKISPKNYVLSPKKEADYKRLIESVIADNYEIGHLFHLWNYAENADDISTLEALEESQNKGLYSLLFLVQALSTMTEAKNPIQLLFVANSCQAVLPNDAIAPEKATVLGFLKTIPQEIPGLRCRHIDLPVGKIDINQTYLLTEFYGLTNDTEVAYREGKRLLPRLQRTEFKQEQPQELPFKTGGAYLISGGLGGIGVKIAEYLLEHYQARLLLVGRTTLQDETQWKTVKDEKLKTKINAYQQLKKLPGEVVYQAVDICDFTGMKQMLDVVLSQWQVQLDGVIHLAGELQEKLIASMTPKSLNQGLQQKMIGTWVLDHLLGDRNQGFFIHFSSVNSFFGGTGVGAYAAANRFQEAFSAYQRASGSRQSYCLSWSMWDEIGMSRGYLMKDLSRAKGYCGISPAQGMDSLLVALAHNRHPLFVGLDESKPYIQQFTLNCQGLQQPTAFLTATIPELSIKSSQICDRFGTATQCHILQLDQMPLTDEGEIDLKQLTQSHVEVKEGEQTEPRNQVERQLQEIWENVLGLENVGINDNFFALGGHSVLAAQAISQMQETFAQQLPLWILFQSPTIAELAQDLTTSEPFSAKVTDGIERENADALLSHPWLVPIKPKGTKPPFFWIHPMAGVIFPYYPVSYLLGGDQPVYGLQSVGLQGEKPPFKRIEQMAADYIEAMRAVQPQGPYYLGGWSLGAYVAYEMAVQLQQADQEVALVALLDTPRALVGSYNVKDVWKLSAELLKMMQEVWPYVYDYLSLETASAPSHHPVKNLIKCLLSILGYRSDLVEVADQYPQLMTGNQQPTLTRLAKILLANTQAIIRYKPPSYDGKVILLKTSDMLQENDPTWGWGEVAQDGVTVHSVPGNHMNLLRQPHVQAIADILKEYLGAVDRGNSHDLEVGIEALRL